MIVLTVPKRANEDFYREFVKALNRGIVGNCDFAIQEISRPDIKETRSALQGTVLRLGDVETRSEEAIEILCKTSKATAIQRPKSWKKFARRGKPKKEGQEEEPAEEEPMQVDENGDEKAIFAQLRVRTDYVIERPASPPKGDGEVSAVEEDVTMVDDTKDKEGKTRWDVLNKEELIRGFKYGSSYAPCPDGQFPKLATRKGIDICGFFPHKGFRREYAMSEVTYVWADTAQPLQQVALSSLVQAMYEKGAMAIARWVLRDGAEPKIGVLHPVIFDRVDCLMFVRVRFAIVHWSTTLKASFDITCRYPSQRTCATSLSPHSRISFRRKANGSPHIHTSPQRSRRKPWSTSWTP